MLPSLFKKLLLMRELKYRNGKFYLMQDIEGLIFPAYAIVGLFKEILEHNKDQGKRILYSIGYKVGWDAVKIYEKMIGNNLHKLISFSAEVMSTIGFGEMHPIEVRTDYAIIRLNPSTIAEIWRERYGIENQPVCYYIAGLLAGGASVIVNREVECIETKCKAKGDDYCEFHLKPAKSKNKQDNNV